MGSTMISAREARLNSNDQFVTVAAPGEGMIILYPGGAMPAAGYLIERALVAGGAALLVDIRRRSLRPRPSAR